MINILFYSKEKEQFTAYIKELYYFYNEKDYSVTFCDNEDLFKQLTSNQLINDYNYIIDMHYDILYNNNIGSILNITSNNNENITFNSNYYNYNDKQINILKTLTNKEAIDKSLNYFELKSKKSLKLKS